MGVIVDGSTLVMRYAGGQPSGICGEDPLPRRSESYAEGCFWKVDYRGLFWGAWEGWVWRGGVLEVGMDRTRFGNAVVALKGRRRDFGYEAEAKRGVDDAAAQHRNT